MPIFSYVGLESSDILCRRLRDAVSTKFPVSEFSEQLSVEVAMNKDFEAYSPEDGVEFDVIHFPSARFLGNAEDRATLLHAMQHVRSSGHIILSQQVC